MEISIKGFILPKTSERFSDCFDRYGYNTSSNKFAISDGVSKSFFPDIWADLLVDSFIKTEGHINLTDFNTYKSLQNEWYEIVKKIVDKPGQKYYVRNFFIQGRPAAATFVGLHFFIETDLIEWEAIALGDSFLFFVPEGIKNINEEFDKLVYLSSKSDFQFNNFPDFFDSRSTLNKGKIKYKKRYLTPGTFYLMTDALAEWFLAERQNAINIISNWNSQTDFEKSLTELRKTTLHNDDSTILIITVKEDNSTLINYKDQAFSYLKTLIESENTVPMKKESESISIQQDSDLGLKKVIIDDTNTTIESESNDIQIKDDQKRSSEAPTIDLNNLDDSKEIKVENKHEKQKKRNMSFWESISYRFWGFWESEETSETKDQYLKSKGDTNLDENKTGNDKASQTEDIEDEDKSINVKRKKKSKSQSKSKRSDEDITSITDKF